VLAPSIAEAARLGKLSDASPSVAKLALAAARASMMRGDYAALSGNPKEATLAWSRGLAIINRKASAGSVPRDPASLQLIERITARQANTSMLTHVCRW
jgi:hypothetical protein